METATDGLWNKDVVEVFLKPGAARNYFEIEVSPLGQWADMRIVEPRVEVDLEWNSDLELETLGLVMETPRLHIKQAAVYLEGVSGIVL